MKKSDLHQPMNIGRHLIPGFWRYALPDDFQYFQFPEEKKAQCGQCPKIKDGYDPKVKCCTYNPRVANFFLGFALEGGNGSRLVRQLVEEGYATPEGLQETVNQTQKSFNAYGRNLFGQKGQPACRFQDEQTGFCGIYPYRNSVCSSFFCYVDHGEESREFWDRFQSVAGQIETALALWCMEKLGIDVEGYYDVFAEASVRLDQMCAQDSDCWDEGFLQKIWGKWWQREEEFYRHAAELIECNKKSLFEIACQTKLIMPHRYDQAIYQSLSEDGQKEMLAHGAIEGTPVRIEDLWYQLQLANRNLQLAADLP